MRLTTFIRSNTPPEIENVLSKIDALKKQKPNPCQADPTAIRIPEPQNNT